MEVPTSPCTSSPEISSSRAPKPFKRVRPLQHLTSSLVLHYRLNLIRTQEAAVFLVNNEVRVNAAELLVLLANPFLFAYSAGVGMAALGLLTLAAFAVVNSAGGVGLRHFRIADRRLVVGRSAL